jgi:phage virion morphogenesis protein
MFKYEIVDDQLSDALARIDFALADTTKLMQGIAEHLLETTRKRILGGQAPDGSSHPPKSPTTIAHYRATGYNKGAVSGPLIRTGDLLNFGLSNDAGDTWAEVASNAVYAAVMQFGAPKGSLGAYSGTNKNGHRYSGVAPWGDIPARPFLGFSEEDRVGVLDSIAEYLAKAWHSGK